MRETFRNLASVGKQWEEQNIEDPFKIPRRNISHIPERLCESKEGGQGEETFSQIPDGI
ncbi:ZNF627 isoform 3, partial [Pan troglodytes]